MLLARSTGEIVGEKLLQGYRQKEMGKGCIH